MGVCSICKEQITEGGAAMQTACLHTVHQECMNTWTNQNQTVCPECQTPLKKKEIPRVAGKSTQMTLRPKDKTTQNIASTSKQVQQVLQQLQQQQLQQQQQQKPQPEEELSSEQGLYQQQAPTMQTQRINAPTTSDEENLRSVVSAVVADTQAAMITDLETNLSLRMERLIETSLSKFMQQMQINNNTFNANTQANHNMQRPSGMMQQPLGDMESPMNRSQFNRHIDHMNFSEASSGNNSSHIARLISSWNIKFDGSPRLSVESFIYRLESQVIDTLNGNFNLLCENIQSLLTDAAKDWYWCYRRSVSRVTWPSFCEALRQNFGEHKTDTEIKEAIRNRKQGPNETFDDYRHAIYKLTERLVNQIPERELVEIMQRGLRPRIRQQLLYISVNSVAELRKLCLKGEHLINEINKTTAITTSKSFPQRKIEAIDFEVDAGDHRITPDLEVDEVKSTSFNCWNCQKKGHRYYDCLEEKAIFCYGCGEANTYKPSCAKCNSGNVKTSEAYKPKSRYDTNH